jgi:CRP-like cAMP-binding protein
MVIRLLETGIYMPGEYIISKGDVGTSMFFITNGEANVYVNGKKVDTKSKG